MLDFRRVVKNRKIQPEAAFCPTKNQGLEWMNSNPRMQIAVLNKSVADYISIFRIFSLITSRFCRAFIGKWLILNRYGVLILII